jgi:phosphoribosylformimino-5-aminoimidazole carboxamide ribotide isomerase
MDGHAVHARRGDRSRYRPLCSTLCNSSVPLQVATALKRLHDFSTLYIADLDAILRRGHNQRHIDAIARRFPDLCLWIDTGLRDRAALARLRRRETVAPVVGSESLTDTRLLDPPSGIAAHWPVLSLDFLGDEFLGPLELLSRPGLWPSRIIAMQLASVGSDSGPDLDRLRGLVAMAPAAHWYAGGGVRHVDDLQAVAQLGMSGALVATALHSGALTRSVLAGQIASG